MFQKIYVSEIDLLVHFVVISMKTKLIQNPKLPELPPLKVLIFFQVAAAPQPATWH